MLPVAQLSAFCADHRLAPKIVFVPSAQVGYGLTTAMAAAGRPFVDLRTVAPQDLANTWALPELLSEGRRPVVQDALLLDFRPIVQDVIANDPDGPFAGQVLGPGLLAAIHRTLRALRIAGVAPDEMARTDAAGGKTPVIARLLQKYEELLADRNWIDGADVFRTAIARITDDHPESHAVFGILDETPVPGLARRFVEAASAGKLTRLGRTTYGISPPAQSAAGCFPDAPLQPSDASVASAGRILESEPTAGDLATVALVESAGPEIEIRNVLRDVTRRNIPLDTVEIAYTSESLVGYLHNAGRLFRLGVTFAVGLPVTLSRPGQALRGFYTWIADGFPVDGLVALCRTGQVTLGQALERGQSLTAPEFAAILVRARIRSGIEAYHAGLDRLERAEFQRLEAISGHREQDQDPPELPEYLETARNVLGTLLGVLPPAGKCSLSDLAHSGIAFLETFVPFSGEGEAPARDSLRDRLEKLQREAGSEAPVRDLARDLAELVAAHKIESAAPKAGGLHAAPLNRAGYAGREHLYIIGLDESLFPGSPTEDPVLLDAEREALSPDLERLRSRPTENVWHLVRLLGASSGKVTLSSSTRRLSDGRETFPSPVFQQFAQLKSVDPTRSDLLPSEPDASLSDPEWLLAHRATPGAREFVDASAPWLGFGESAVAGHVALALSRYNGLTGARSGELSVTSDVLSASRLETLARCPYRYFLRYVLRVHPRDEGLGDPSRWLTPAEFGGLVHRLFQRFMASLRDRGERANESEHRVLLGELLQEEVARTETRIPVHSPAAKHADVRRLEAAAEIFLAAEARLAATTDTEPYGFEVSFGFGDTRGHSHADPVDLQLGPVRLELRGLIDRIDRLGNDFAIWDYKTGSMAPYRRGDDLLTGGLHLQWALYGHALAQMLTARGEKPDTITSGYYFTSDREHGQKLSETPPTAERVGSLLHPLLQVAEAGAFPRVQKSDQCLFCDYAPVCRGQRVLPWGMGDVREQSPNHVELVDRLDAWLNAE